MAYFKILKDLSVELTKLENRHHEVCNIVTHAVKKHGLAINKLPETDDGSGVFEKAFLQILADLRFAYGNELLYGSDDEAYSMEYVMFIVSSVMPDDSELPMSTYPIKSIEEYDEVLNQFGLK